MIDPKVAGSIPDALRKAARRRTDEVTERLKATMESIKREMSENNGIYPYNKGRINQSEVCRRAEVSKVTLQGAAHKSTTKLIVDKFVASCITKRVPQVRAAITNRADQWKAHHDNVASHYAVAMLELNEATHQIKKLQAENAALREELRTSGNSKIAVLKPRS
jgi:hypothetical protein